MGLGQSYPDLVSIFPARTEVLEKGTQQSPLPEQSGEGPRPEVPPITPCPATAPGPAPRSAQSHSHADPVSLGPS